VVLHKRGLLGMSRGALVSRSVRHSLEVRGYQEETKDAVASFCRREEQLQKRVQELEQIEQGLSRRLEDARDQATIMEEMVFATVTHVLCSDKGDSLVTEYSMYVPLLMFGRIGPLRCLRCWHTRLKDSISDLKTTKAWLRGRLSKLGVDVVGPFQA
jgi:hypothetical protein